MFKDLTEKYLKYLIVQLAMRTYLNRYTKQTRFLKILILFFLNEIFIF